MLLLTTKTTEFFFLFDMERTHHAIDHLRQVESSISRDRTPLIRPLTREIPRSINTVRRCPLSKRLFTIEKDELESQVLQNAFLIVSTKTILQNPYSFALNVRLMLRLPSEAKWLGMARGFVLNREALHMAGPSPLHR